MDASRACSSGQGMGALGMMTKTILFAFAGALDRRGGTIG